MADIPDRKALWTAGVGVAVVALTAAVISFSHVRQLALDAGESRLASWLLPISIDGAIAAAVAVILADSRAGRRPAALTWMLLALGLACSLAANIASAEPTMVARAVAAWPPVALALGIEVLAGLARRRDRMTERPPAGVERRVELPHKRGPVRDPGSAGHQGGALSTTPASAGSAKAGAGPSNGVNGSRTPGSSPTSGRVKNGSPGRMPVGRPPFRDDVEAVDVIRQLDAGAPGGRASRLEIQKRLGCGGSRAARLADLARGR